MYPRAGIEPAVRRSFNNSEHQGERVRLRALTGNGCLPAKTPRMYEFEKLKEESSMKRAFFAPLLMSMTFLALSCAKSPNSNESMTPPAPPPASKPVRVTITYGDGTPEQFKIDVDDGVRIRKSLDTIKWRVKYVGPGSAIAADVTLDDFRFGSETNPFGDGSVAKNKFRFDPSPNGPDKTADTEASSKSGVFKYRISVTLPNGKVLIVDPVVIIDN